MYNKEKIPKAVRVAVWNKYIGNTSGMGKCYVGCGEQISQNNFECGHIISEKLGGKVMIDNLRPICSSCNKSMGAKNMEDFIKKYNFVKDDNFINNIVKYNCLHCDFKTNDDAAWHFHKGIHIGPSQEDSQSINLTDGNNVKLKKYYCPECNYTTTNPSSWSKHKRTNKHKEFTSKNDNNKIKFLEEKILLIEKQSVKLLEEKNKQIEDKNKQIDELKRELKETKK